MFGLSQKSLVMITEAIAQFPEIKEAVVFGSRAMGNYKKGSDVDIALKGENVNQDTVLRLSVILNQKMPLPYLFDLVDYQTIKNQELVEHINQFGKPISKS